MTVATIHKIGNKKFTYSVAGGKKVTLDCALLCGSFSGVKFVDDAMVLIQVPLSLMPVLKMDKKFYLPILPSGGHIQGITKKQAESGKCADPHKVEVKKQRIKFPDGPNRMSNAYIVRYGKNLYFIATGDGDANAFEWAKRNGLPFVTE